ncbi:methyl-accepting chemotaxis protein [Geomonas sp. RF6]|uniref:methyl-accepting chemotaxis protein n=1 Tax=Geomonas sp. RF6 TaxID=2897342 RepID=UPI001E2C9DA1|nr:methyl-accepting chemotaxis protein [Geomonas sp. RF6]UFS70816.1 methyl-accepting chemotaxis protein [Geomonas sp. RF6]
MYLSIRKKISLGTIVVTALVVAVGACGLWVQGRMNGRIANLETQAEKLILLSELNLQVERSLMPANDYLITGKPKFRDDFSVLSASVEKKIDDLKGKPFLTQQESKDLEDVRGHFTNIKRLSEEILHRDHRDASSAATMEVMDYKYGAPLSAEVEGMNRAIRLSFEEARREAARLSLIGRSATIGAIVVVIAILCSAGISLRRSVTRSFDTVAGMLKEIADGKGDLTRRIEVDSQDEIGDLAQGFNRFMDQLQETVREVTSAAGGILSSADRVQDSSHSVHTAAQAQSAAIEYTRSSTEQLDASIRAIAEDTGKLQHTLSIASSSSREISSALDGVRDLTEKLDSSADSTLAAINQIAFSFTAVASNVEALSVKADEVAASTLEINAVAKEINASSQEQAKMARTVKDHAALHGLSAVNKTKERMEKIQGEVTETAEVMGRLGTMSREINRIVNIIRDVAEKTKLLALNASILAAQAGVHGKGFAVVAEEIKDLALQTANSTQEITHMVKQVQEETLAAVDAAKRSSVVVGEGMHLTLEAEAALNEIISKAEMSLEQSVKMARSAAEQTTGIGVVSESLQKMNFMVAQINRSAAEQKESTGIILRSTEDMRNHTHSVREKIVAQSNETQRIAALIEDIFQLAHVIAQNTSGQQKASEIIVTAINILNQKAEEQSSLAGDLDNIVRVINEEANNLHSKVGVFQI